MALQFYSGFYCSTIASTLFCNKTKPVWVLELFGEVSSGSVVKERMLMWSRCPFNGECEN